MWTCIIWSVFLALVATGANAVYGPAQYPAGVSPQACPNYPLCSNPAVAVHQPPVAAPQQLSPYAQNLIPAAQHYAPATHHFHPLPPAAGHSNGAANRPQYSPNVQSALDRGEYIGDGDYHGEGLDEASDPGYHAYNSGPVIGHAAAAPAVYQQPYHHQPAAAAAAAAISGPIFSPHHQPQRYTAIPAPVAHNAQHHGVAQVPAGVDPRACPNYPYCPQ